MLSLFFAEEGIAAEATAAAESLHSLAAAAAKEKEAENAKADALKVADKKAKKVAKAAKAAAEAEGGSSKLAAPSAAPRTSGRAGKASLHQEQLDEEKAAKEDDLAKKKGKKLHSQSGASLSFLVSCVRYINKH